MGVESLRDGVILKAREKADEIVRNAEVKARELLSNSLKEYEERVKEEVERQYRTLRSSYEMMYISELLKLSAELMTLKNEVLRDVKVAVIERLSNLDLNTRKRSLKNLLKESLSYEVIKESEGFIIYVVNADRELIREILSEEGLEEKVVEVRILGDECLGGIVLESRDGSVLIDNTYLTRVERGLNIVVSRLQGIVFKEVRR